jgi:biopolymer transport protein ExbD
MDEKPFETLNVIPFVDIMLVLLTMVLTTASFIATGRIPMVLPQVAATKNELEVRSQKAILIEIAADGAINFEGAAVDLNSLRARLAAMASDAPVTIRADRAVAFQHFVDVANLLRRMNFSKVGIQTQSIARAERAP